jgi:hypothetical protein
MLHDERDFRAIIFSSKKIDSLASVQRLLAETPQLGRPDQTPIPSQSKMIEAFRMNYYSNKCYLRTFDPVKRELYAKQEKEGQPFRYEIFVILDYRTTPPLIFIAVPFAGMTFEVFGRIHQNRPDASFQYHRPKLEELVAKLSTPAGAIRQLRTVRVNWLVAGDESKCDQITLGGNSVAHSLLFTWFNDALMADAAVSDKRSAKKGVHDLAVTLRKVEVCYDNEAGREMLTMSFDRFGNYVVWVSDEGVKLPIVFEVIDRLRKRHFLTAESKFPVRNRNNEPRL